MKQELYNVLVKKFPDHIVTISTAVVGRKYINCVDTRNVNYSFCYKSDGLGSYNIILIVSHQDAVENGRAIVIGDFVPSYYYNPDVDSLEERVDALYEAWLAKVRRDAREYMLINHLLC